MRGNPKGRVREIRKMGYMRVNDTGKARGACMGEKSQIDNKNIFNKNKNSKSSLEKLKIKIRVYLRRLAIFDMVYTSNTKLKG